MIKNRAFLWLFAWLSLTHTSLAHSPNFPQSELVRFSSNATFNEEYHNRRIAEYSLQKINGSARQIHDPFVVDYFYRLSNDMNTKVRAQSLLALPVLDNPSINAFAIPGGLIGINTGTLLSSKSLDETASVIAHEIAHLSLRHYERGNDEKNKLIAMQVGGLLAAIALSAATGDGATAAMIGAQTMSAENRAAHSRSHEKEADRVGMQILVKSGFDASAMPRFFKTLEQQVALNTPKDAYIPSFMQTHPFSLERLSEATNQAKNFPSPSTAQKSAYAKDFDLLYWRVSYLSRQSNKETLKHRSKESIGAKLALIALLADERAFDEAKAEMASFERTQPTLSDEPLVCITKGHIAYEQKAYEEAVKHLSTCQAIYPERRDLALYLADSKLHAGDSAGAIRLLTPLVAKQAHDILAWDLLQKAYEKQAQKHTDPILTAKALQARAQGELWRADYDKSLVSLTQAKNFAKNNGAFLAVLDKELEKVKAYKNFKP